MAATARTTATRRKPPARPALPPVEDDEVIDLGEPDPETEPERELLFRIAGTEHTMLKEPPPALALSALELAERRGGTEQAVAFADVYIMREMLGDKSYRALLGCKTMTRAQYIKIVNRVMTRAMGALEDEDGSPNR